MGDKHLAGPSHVGLFICETLKVKHYTYHGHNIFLEAFMSRLVSHSHSPFAKFIEYYGDTKNCVFGLIFNIVYDSIREKSGFVVSK